MKEWKNERMKESKETENFIFLKKGESQNQKKKTEYKKSFCKVFQIKDQMLL